MNKTTQMFQDLGWQLVPIIPTVKMMQAGRLVNNKLAGDSTISSVYAAMLEKAPPMDEKIIADFLRKNN